MDYAPIIRRITPEQRPPVEGVVADLSRGIRRERLDAEVMVGGSVAKGTHLRGQHDVDIFIRFSTDYASDALSDLLARIVPADAQRLHGSRDYFVLERTEATYEIVPVLRIDDWRKARNVTDMSPLHVDYIKRHLRRRPRLADEIRLAKQWCRAQRVYGAESYIAGLSGHVLDLLIIHYGSFDAFINACARWEPPVVIDLEGHHRDPQRSLNRAKTRSPLIMIDPLQPDRNAAAALSEERFERLVRAARAFTARPRTSAFTLRPLTPQRIVREHGAAPLAIVSATPLRGKRDIAGAKCRRVYEHLTRQLRRAGFAITATDWEFTPRRAIMYWRFAQARLPRTHEVQGPPTNKGEDARRFRARHERIDQRGGRLYALEQRRHTTPRSLLRELLTHDEVTVRVEQIALEPTKNGR